MRFEVSIDNLTQDVELRKLAASENGRIVYESTVSKRSGEPTRLVVEHQDGNAVTLRLKNKIFQVKVLRQSGNHVDFLLNGREIKASRGRKASVESSSNQAGSDIATVKELVTSNFPAKVVAVPAAKGSTIEEGDTILVLEAMKMEARVKAPRSGAVLEIYVKEGEMVNRGSKLVRLKFNP